jgi:hypothetical protein
MRSTGDCVGAKFPKPSTVHAKASSPGDRADPVLGPSDLVLGKAGSGTGVHDLGRRLDSSGQKRMKPCVALETIARLPFIEGLSCLGPDRILDRDRHRLFQSLDPRALATVFDHGE